MMVAIAILMMVAGAATLFYDSYMSVKGIRAGVAEEGAWYLRKLFGPKPTAMQFFKWDVGEYLGIVAPMLAWFIRSGQQPELYMFSVIFLAVSCLRHYLGGRKWANLSKH